MATLLDILRPPPFSNIYFFLPLSFPLASSPPHLYFVESINFISPLGKNLFTHPTPRGVSTGPRAEGCLGEKSLRTYKGNMRKVNFFVKEFLKEWRKPGGGHKKKKAG